MTAFLKKLTVSLEPLIGRESLSWQAAGSQESQAVEARAMLRLHRREAQRQRNLERILEMAAEELQEDVADDVVTEDWLSTFVDLACDVADDTAQRVWARILALQVAVPDAVFKRTLIHLHGMDLWELNGFAEFCSFAFAFESGWRFVFEDDVTRQENWSYTRGNDYTQHFINTGLLAPELSTLRGGGAKGLRIRYYDDEYRLAPGTAGSASALVPTEPETGYRRFTATGQQLTKALRVTIYKGYARNVITRLSAERRIDFQRVDEDGEGL